MGSLFEEGSTGLDIINKLSLHSGLIWVASEFTTIGEEKQSGWEWVEIPFSTDSAPSDAPQSSEDGHTDGDFILSGLMWETKTACDAQCTWGTGFSKLKESP